MEAKRSRYVKVPGNPVDESLFGSPASKSGLRNAGSSIVKKSNTSPSVSNASLELTREKVETLKVCTLRVIYMIHNNKHTYSDMHLY